MTAHDAQHESNLRLALGLLGVGFVLSILSILALSLTGHRVPDVLQNLAVGSMAAIGALLTRGPSDGIEE